MYEMSISCDKFRRVCVCLCVTSLTHLLCELRIIADDVFISPQVAIHVCNKGGSWSNVRVSTGTGQKGRTDSSASGGSREVDPGGVRTLPHEDNQLRGESQSRLCLHQLLGRALVLPAPAVGAERRGLLCLRSPGVSLLQANRLSSSTKGRTITWT